MPNILTAPGPYTVRAYRDRIEKNFEMERAGETLATRMEDGRMVDE